MHFTVTHSERVLLLSALFPVRPPGGAVGELIQRVVDGISKQVGVCSGPEKQEN